MDHLLDEELVQEFLSGNQQAFEVLVQRYQKQVFSLAYRLCGSYEEAADYAQDAFLQVYRNLNRYDSNRRFFPWLYRVAHNTCINSMNRRPKPAVDLEEISSIVADDAGHGPEQQYANQELRETIYREMLELPESYREPVLLRFVEELSYKEIAERMAVPISTVETRIYRGRQLLQEKLAVYAGRRRS